MGEVRGAIRGSKRGAEGLWGGALMEMSLLWGRKTPGGVNEGMGVIN